MANVKLVFYGTEKSLTEQTELTCFLNKNNEIAIVIEDEGLRNVCLDKSTAIRLAKTLRTEINKMEDLNND